MKIYQSECGTHPFSRSLDLTKILHHFKKGEGVVPYLFDFHNSVRSRLRYWMASEIWWVAMYSTPSRSAMVRAIFRMRV